MLTSLFALSLANAFLHRPATGGTAAPMAISVRLDQPGARISPSLYGIFFEEINQAGEGGIYGEMLQNRGLEKADAPLPGWKLGVGVTVASDGPNEAHPRSFAIPSGGTVANSGFGGLAIEKGVKYHVTIWAKGSGTVGVGFGEKPIKLGKGGDHWKRLEKTIQSGGTATNVDFVVTALDGPVDVAYVSLVPEKLWKGRKNGMRPDLAQKVDAIHPAFVRFPGGCYVEGGDRFSEAFDWKATLGPVDERKGMAHTMWGYPVSNGLGFHEYLQWCEDMGSTPLFVVNCGLNHAQMTPLAEMDHWTGYALDAIEYANGPTTSKWGAQRAKNGHPTPFGLKYVEIGNENGGWAYGGDAAYGPRYKIVYDAIKAKYPDIVTIANNRVDHPMEVVDEHYYSDPGFFWKNANRYDAYDRTGPKVYVGEYAVTKGCGTGNLAAALGEAAFMTGMERNSDVVRMSSYAPLFVNVANRQWNPNAIVFNASQAYGTPSYHVQAMFANNRPDRNVTVSFPTTTGTAPKPGGGIGLMTWNTAAEFKDVVLKSGGRTLYSSEGIGASGIGEPQGRWSVKDGTIVQSALETDRTATLTGATAPEGDYTLDLKARKRAGEEGFLVVVDMRDGGQLRWNVGGWGNTQTGFERNGAVTGERIPFKVETGRWYDVRLERTGDTVRGYLDGKLVQELKETGAPDLAAVAGIDEKAKELVIKVVNGSDVARPATLNLTGGRVGDVAKMTVLTGSNLLAENSFALPTAVAPVETKVAWNGTTTFAPHSVTVLRLAIR